MRSTRRSSLYHTIKKKNTTQPQVSTLVIISMVNNNLYTSVHTCNPNGQQVGELEGVAQNKEFPVRMKVKRIYINGSAEDVHCQSKVLCDWRTSDYRPPLLAFG